MELDKQEWWQMEVDGRMGRHVSALCLFKGKIQRQFKGMLGQG